uniref:Uncharacterized protein n=1 Tax=Romanomermis culicivorax TaxID=13658 RepID=A0A915IE82_ROMCU
MLNYFIGVNKACGKIKSQVGTSWRQEILLPDHPTTSQCWPAPVSDVLTHQKPKINSVHMIPCFRL